MEDQRSMKTEGKTKGTLKDWKRRNRNLKRRRKEQGDLKGEEEEHGIFYEDGRNR